VTTKAVERTAEAIGGDIAQGEREEIQRAVWAGQARRKGGPPTPGKSSRMRLHPDHVGQRGLPHPRSGFHHLHQRDRERRRVWQTNLPGSLESRLEPRGEESRHRRRRRMDLEQRRPAFPGRDTDRRSVSRSPIPVGCRPQAASQRRSEPESVDEGPPEAAARPRENRKAGSLAAVNRFHQPGSRRQDSYRGGLLREKCRAHALPKVSPPASLCRLGRHRSWLQDRYRFTSQTVRHVLDGSGSDCCATATLSAARPVRAEGLPEPAPIEADRLERPSNRRCGPAFRE